MRRPSLESVEGPALFEKQIKLLELRRFRFYFHSMLRPLGTATTDQERKLAKNERATEDDKEERERKRRKDAFPRRSPSIQNKKGEGRVGQRA